MWSPSEYEKLVAATAGCDDTDAKPYLRLNQRSYRKFILALTALLIGTAGFLVVGLLLVRGSPSTTSRDSFIMDCGQSPDEAHARGCRYEPLGSAWIPSLCSFQEVIDRYDDIFDRWTWFSDPGLTDPLEHSWQLDLLRTGNYSSVFTSAQNAHEVHCLYTWRKLNFAMEQNKSWIDARSLEYSHAEHCAVSLTQIISDDDQVPLRAEKHRHKNEFDGKRHPNATEWPIMFHRCTALQHF